MKKFITEFKEFALKGNVMDLAVGMMIGAAFGFLLAFGVYILGMVGRVAFPDM